MGCLPATHAVPQRRRIAMTRNREEEKHLTRTISAEDQEQLIRDCLWLFPDVGEEWIRGSVGSLDDLSFCSHQSSVLVMIVERGATPGGERLLQINRAAILDALVRLDCGFGWKGTEPEVVPSAGNVRAKLSLCGR
jgi:hypothetical protein